MIVSTIINGENLHKAVLMGKSIKSHMPQARIVVCVVEEELYPGVEAYFDYFDEVVFAKDICGMHFHRIIFKYTKYQCASAIRGLFFKYLFYTNPSDSKIIYTAPDLITYNPFVELIDLLNYNSIVLTPLYLEPSDIDDCSREIRCLNEGAFDHEFIGLRKTKEAERFVHWYTDVIQLDHRDPATDSLIDRQWLDFIPSFFDGVSILNHPGYNVGPWNSHEKRRQIHIQNHSLRCFRFSDIEAYSFEPQSPLYTLKNDYMDWLNSLSGLSLKEWSYDYFNTGEKISDQSRAFFRNKWSEMDPNLNPFTASNHFFT